MNDQEDTIDTESVDESVALEKVERIYFLVMASTLWIFIRLYEKETHCQVKIWCVMDSSRHQHNTYTLFI